MSERDTGTAMTEHIAIKAALLRLFKNEYRDSGDRHSDALFAKDGYEAIGRELALLRKAHDEVYVREANQARELAAAQAECGRLKGLLAESCSALDSYTSGHAEESSVIICTCCEKRVPFCAPDCAVTILTKRIRQTLTPMKT